MDAAATARSVADSARRLGLAGRPLCLHASLRSFGWVDGGAPAVIGGLLAAGCTVLVPSFSWGFAVPPPSDQRPARNGWDYARFAGPTAGLGRVYTPDSLEVDADMGAVSAAVLATPGRRRGDNPICSFAAVGPLAADLVAAQSPTDMYAPLRALAAADGSVVLMGVGLDKMTLLHLAEKVAGRNMFRRWANRPDGRPAMVEVGGCSDGFEHFAPVLAPLTREMLVGRSLWRAFPAEEALAAAAGAIRADPRITHCGGLGCDRCDDAALGGPLLGAGPA